MGPGAEGTHTECLSGFRLPHTESPSDLWNLGVFPFGWESRSMPRKVVAGSPHA